MSAAAQAPSLARRAVAELAGTGFLLSAVVGSGVMGERLAGGNVALALLANTAATGAVLVALVRWMHGAPVRGRAAPASALAALEAEDLR